MKTPLALALLAALATPAAADGLFSETAMREYGHEQGKQLLIQAFNKKKEAEKAANQTRPDPLVSRCGSVMCGDGLSATKILPPAEFDRPYTGQFYVTYAGSKADVRDLCKRPADPYGLACSYAMGKTCWIIIAPKEDIEAQGLTMEITMRHEIGHCNGWSQEHKGSRLIDWHRTSETGKVMAKP